ncbi:lipid kinase [Caenispirillum salinarum]|uniref:lipid kinase n=1 Tax=Caenispirillum salinarum TaxID=859058 RepID=UPI00384F0248
MTARRRALLIINGNASRAFAELDDCLAVLRDEGGLDVQVLESKSPDHVRDLIAEHGQDAAMVIMAGGDGTMNAAVDHVHAQGLAFGVMPLGTANDLARTLEILPDPVEAARVIARGRRHRIDLGRVNGKLFFNVASIGAAAQLSKNLDGALKRRWGVLSYPIRVREVLDEGQAFAAHIEDDEGNATDVQSIQVAVGNGRCYGGGMRVAPEAAIDDGRLDLYSLEPQSLWRLVLTAPLIRAGWHDQLESSVKMSGRRFTISTDPPMDVSTDGEVTTCTPAVFEVLPEALEIIVPVEYEPGRPTDAGEDEDMLRDARVVAVDDVIVALKRSLGDMAEEIHADHQQPKLANLLREASARRQPVLERLEDAVRAMGDLPSTPDADRQAWSHLATRLMAGLLGTEARTLTEAAIDDEIELIKAVDDALALEDLPGDLRKDLEGLRADAEATRTALRTLAKET